MSEHVTRGLAVGVLGGMGVRAGVAFVQYLLDATPARRNSDYFRILLDSRPDLPSRYSAVRLGGPTPVPLMVESINGLAAMGADVVTVPCNSAHYFYGQVQPEIRIPWISMIDLVGRWVVQRWQRPLFLGSYITSSRRLYDAVLPDAEYLNDEERAVVDRVIDAMKANDVVDERDRDVVERLVAARGNNIDVVVLACTELSLTRWTRLADRDVVDSSRLYAALVAERVAGVSSGIPPLECGGGTFRASP